MKSWFNIYIFIALYCFGMVSCTDESMVNDDSFDKVVVRMTLSVPGADSRVGGDYQLGGTKADSLDANILQQRYIDDVYILLFNSNDHTLIAASPATFLDNKNGEATRTIEGKFSQRNSSINIVVLANLEQNGLVDFTNYKGKTEQEIYEALVYEYPKAGWKLDENARFLPMWGKQTNITLSQREISISNFELYRGVAKMGVQVATTAQEKFTLKEVYVYNVNSKGYCAAPTKRPDVGDTNNNRNDQFEEPEIPAVDGAPCVQLSAPLEYKNITNNAIHNQIYLSESNNKNPGTDRQPLVVVVGGIYNGDGLVENNGSNLTYYRIDMKDDKEATTDGVLAPFDIIRNHSYIFNITAVNNPGTPTPEEALDEAVVGLTVEVKDWIDEYMRGVPDQYTLTTNKSVITYEAYNDKNGQTIDISTDYSDGWYLEGLDEAESAWLNISPNNGSKDETTTITLTPRTDNNGVTRIANFFVVAGNIKKEITVRQPQPPTANCYVRGNGTYELIVSIKGNGNDGILPEGQDIVPGDGDASITPDKIGIIWETKEGLVTLTDGDGIPTNNGTLTYGSKSTSLVDYNHDTNTIEYTVNTSGASIGGKEGGNALIGAFKLNSTTKKYEVIWSWHIWVSPDIIDPNTKAIKEDCVEKWTLNDYDVLDRNLGALANRPVEEQTDNTKSVASMGLLYQWGRKDPFIGAAYSNDNFPSSNPTGVLPVVHYYENWDTENITSDLIDYTITHPTHLIFGGSENNPTGLSSVTAIDEEGETKTIGGYLWGTNNGLSTTVKDLGSKTIYDPCPVGYRVPPVDAFVFKATGTWRYIKGELVEQITVPGQNNRSKDYGYAVYYSQRQNQGEILDEDGNITIYNNNRNERTYYVWKAVYTNVAITSETENWRNNLIYVPHYVNDMSDNNIQWGDNSTVTEPFIYDGEYITDAEYYGFYLNYAQISEPKLTTDKRSGTYYENNSTYNGTSTGNYYYKPQTTETTITWLPLTGAYDPTNGVTFQGVSVEQGSSISVNSFLWTNSSVNNGGEWIPGAMFLHGTENTYSLGSGRHIHNLTDDEIRAQPHYAGAVRCVRDRAKTKWDINSLTEAIGISYDETKIITIVSVNSDWELIDPGQPWLQVTPDKGTADKGQGTDITLKLLQDVDAGSKTTLVFKIANEMETRSCVVTVE